MLDKNISGVCGEYYVLSQLLRKGYEAYLSHGATQKGWDIVVCLDDNKITVQVKTVQWKESSKTIQGNWENKDFDVLVIVILNRKKDNNKIQPYDVLVFHKNEIKAKDKNKKSLFNDKKQICYRNKTITLNTLYSKSNKGNYNRYKNKWNKIQQIKETKNAKND